MSNNICEKVETVETHQIPASSAGSSVRSLFTRQTGEALITLGTLFKHIPPFNETIDKSTGDTLISIGRKLRK